jgi:hypothetical protein
LPSKIKREEVQREVHPKITEIIRNIQKNPIAIKEMNMK